MKLVKDVKFLNSNIFEQQTKDQISLFFQGKLDVIVSDMAKADTTGK